MPRATRLRVAFPIVVSATVLMAGAHAASATTGAVDTGASPVYGATVQLQSGEMWSAGIARIESSIGHLGVVRVFQKAPDPRILTPLGPRSGIISFGLPPADVLSGMYDAQFKAFFAAAPTDHTTWWSYYHEADVAFQQGRITDLVQYRAAYQRIAQLARAAGNPQLKNAVILVGWTANPNSGLKVSDFMPANDLVDVIAYDNYNGWFQRNGLGYGDPTNMIELDKAAAAGVGKPFAVAEFGSLVENGDYAGRAAWITAFSKTAAQYGAKFVSYYDSDKYGTGAEYRLLDAPSQLAYRAVLAGQGSSVPAAPVSVVVTATDGGALVGWSPADSNGLPRLGYTVTAVNTSTRVPLTVALAGDATSTQLSGLTNGQSYDITVLATNSLGDGQRSAVQTVVPGLRLAAPSAPTVTAAAATDRAAAVSWQAPADNGGSSITSYTVTATDSSGAVAGTVTADGATTSATVSGLTNGRPYVLQVVAVNNQGSSPAASSAVVTPWSAPGAPTAVRATGGNVSATATWTAPASDGGAPISAYTVTAYNSGTGALVASRTVSGSSTSGTVTGLVNGKSYVLKVTAANGATGPMSAASNVVLAATLPGAPVASAGGGVLTDDVTSATVWWQLPSANGGAQISGFLITTYLYNGTTLVSTTVLPVQPAAARTLKVAGLTRTSTYRFSVQAVNAVGAGVASPQTNLVKAY